MKYLKNIILLFVFLNSFYGFTQCETVKSLFENDLYASKELRDYASKADDPDKVFDAWHLLLEEKSLEKTNVKVLKEVEDNYQAIKNAGGYSKWKNVNGGKVDDLFASILNQGDFQGFRNLCKNNPKVTVELVDDSWHTFTSETKSTYGIGSKRNLATIEFDGQKKIIASGEGYNSQMANSGQFIPEEFIIKVKNGERVFEPTIVTRHLDTELIGLEYFAKQKGAVKGKRYPEVTGEIKVTSDLCPCPSCSAIFQQFSDMFPNVNIKVVTSPKLHY
ncbi:deaminase domain-containing protein [Flavobacterium davisii]|nr:deaminase domain-containing protein [Flavobacterium davisii]